MRYAEYVLVVARRPEKDCTTYTENYYIRELVRTRHCGVREVVEARLAEEGGGRLSFIAIEPSHFGPSDGTVAFVDAKCRRYPKLGDETVVFQGATLVRDLGTIIPVLLDGNAERGVWREYLAERREACDAAARDFDWAAEERAHRALVDIGWGSEGYDAAHARWCLLYRRKQRIEADVEQVERFEAIDVENLCSDETNTANAAVYLTSKDWEADRARMKAEGLSPDQV